MWRNFVERPCLTSWLLRMYSNSKLRPSAGRTRDEKEGWTFHFSLRNFQSNFSVGRYSYCTYGCFHVFPCVGAGSRSKLEFREATGEGGNPVPGRFFKNGN
jgi:hypothetical protein